MRSMLPRVDEFLSRFAAVLLLFLAFLLLAPSSAHARRGVAPYSPVGQGSLGEPTLRVDAPDVAMLKSEDVANKLAGEKTLRYASPIRVSLSPASDGRWSTLSDGTRLWRMEIEGPGATDINLGFSTFEVPYGGKLWVISTERDYYEGPYTHEDNEEHGQLWVPVVPGSRVIVELQLPAETKFEPRLELDHVGYGYADVFNMDGLPKQGSCNNDVVCPEGLPWADQIQSVAAYSLGGSIFCTGQMVIDANNTFRPFFLTAYHCGLTPSNAPSLVVYWNFESPTCGQLSGGSLSDNQTGATWRTSRQDVDMCLVELDDYPSVSSDVYYAGWDRSGDVPQGSVGIHHPNGDEKAISFNNDPLTSGASCIISGGTANSHWFVDNWEDGTTEPGSSGSALFDPTSQLLIGFLSGGQASCTVIDYDCYGKFAAAWDGTSATSRLRDWLDPNGTSGLQVQGSYISGAGILAYAGSSATDDCAGTSDGVIEPGESVQIFVTASAGIGDVTGITGVLASTTPGVTVVSNSSAWPDILNGASASNLTPFEVTVDPSVACYTDLEFIADLTDDLGNLFPLAFTLPVGQLQLPSGLPLGIPDGNPTGVASTFTLAEDVTLTDLDVRVRIDHTWVGDLTIRLQSPAGTVVTLLDRPGVPASTYGCSDDNLNVTFDDASLVDLETSCSGTTPWYDGIAAPAQALSAFNGESTAGVWTLTVSDAVSADSGQILEWELLSSPAILTGICEPCNAGPATLLASTLATQRVSIMVSPDGSGDRLDAAQQWDGVVGNAPAIVDASLQLQAVDGFGSPIASFPATDIVLESSLGNLALCAGAVSADADGDLNGQLSVSGAPAAGGVSDLVAPETLGVTGIGLVTDYVAGGSGFDIVFNSPDLTGDGNVDLADVGDFAALYGDPAYDYAIDYTWDGVNNLVDIGRLAENLGATCIGVAKRPALASASGRLELSFDANGLQTNRALQPGSEARVTILLSGSQAAEGLRGWEAHLRGSANVRVLRSEVTEGTMNFLGDRDFVVASDGRTLRSEKGSVVLAHVWLTVTDENPAELYLDASPVQSGGANAPVVLVGSEETELRALEASSGPLASLNGESDGTPDATVITRARITNVPNPFNPATEIQFALPRSGDVEVRIYDVSGRLVRRMELGGLDSGHHSVVWSGEDQSGRGVVSGVYFSRLFVDGSREGNSRKMTLMK